MKVNKSLSQINKVTIIMPSPNNEEKVLFIKVIIVNIDYLL